MQYIRDKIKKVNGILKYANGVVGDMEVNTSLLYKSLVRSVTEYSLALYYSKEEVQRLKIERTQYERVRTALGYRCSTSTNIMLAEAKLPLLQDRARFLAKNFCSKVMKYGRENFRKKLVAELSRCEGRHRGRHKSIMVEV